VILQRGQPLPGALKLSLLRRQKCEPSIRVAAATVQILLELVRVNQDQSVTNSANPVNGCFAKSAAASTGRRFAVTRRRPKRSACAGTAVC
jgi:hypothetical protein